MSQVRFKLFDNSKIVYAGFGPVSSQPDRFTWSGTITGPSQIDNFDVTRTYVVSVTARRDAVRVILTYRDAGVQVFIVKPSIPLVLETAPKSDVEELLSIVVEPVNGTADIEALVHVGREVFPPLVPTDAYLVLSPASGVTLSAGTNYASTWKDSRAAGTAYPNTFDSQGAYPVYSAADPEFKLQPTLEFGNSAQRIGQMVAGGLPNDWNFFAQSNWTIAFVAQIRDCGIYNAVIGNGDYSTLPLEGAGVTVGATPYNTVLLEEYRAGLIANSIYGESDLGWSDASPGSTYSRPMVVVVRRSGDTVRVWCEGQEITKTQALAAGATSTKALTIGRFIYRSNVEEAFGRMKLADLRVWKRALTDDERNGYIDFARNSFGVVDTASLQAPAGADVVFKANRGTTAPLDASSPAAIPYWDDKETAESLVAPTSPQPLWRPTDTRFGGRPCIDFAAVPGAYLEHAIAATFAHYRSDNPFTVLAVVAFPANAGQANAIVCGNLPYSGQAPGGFFLSRTNNSGAGGGNYDGVAATCQGEGYLVVQASAPPNYDPTQAATLLLANGGSSAASLYIQLDPPGYNENELPSAGSGQTVTKKFGLGRSGEYSSDSLNAVFAIAELRLYPRSISQSELAAFKAYVADRYRAA